jgi:hypothetical protein
MTTLPVNFATKESFDVYLKYLALKRHFTTESYDFHKYHGKVKASFDSFQTRSDAYFFFKLSKNRNWNDLILANLIKDPNIWVRDLCEESAEQVYVEWKRKIDGLTHHFTSELNKLKPTLEDNFTVANGSHPYVITLLFRNQISLEFFTILTHITNVFPYWKQQLEYDVVAQDAIKLATKYLPFIKVDKKKFATLLKTYVGQHKYEAEH